MGRVSHASYPDYMKKSVHGHAHEGVGNGEASPLVWTRLPVPITTFSPALAPGFASPLQIKWRKADWRKAGHQSLGSKQWGSLFHLVMMKSPMLSYSSVSEIGLQCTFWSSPTKGGGVEGAHFRLQGEVVCHITLPRDTGLMQLTAL